MRNRLLCILLMSICLLFSGHGVAANFGGGSNFAGEWSSNQGKMLLQQSGNQVTGTYGGKSGKIQGTVNGNRLAGTYQWTDKSGTFEFTMGTDAKSFQGSWRRTSAQGTWTGTRLSGGGSSNPASTGQLSGTSKPTTPAKPSSGTYPSAAAAGANSFEAICDGCGAKSVALGRHRFCALTGVASGGSASGCYVRQNNGHWTLEAVDPRHNPAGQSQRCFASCLD